MTHTPGPWYMDEKQVGDLHRYIGHWEDAEKTMFHCIARTHLGNDAALGEANAQLMAAAPDLLEALQLLEAEMVLSGNAGSEDYGWKPAIQKTRAAITKAIGDPT